MAQKQARHQHNQIQIHVNETGFNNDSQNGYMGWKSWDLSGTDPNTEKLDWLSKEDILKG